MTITDIFLELSPLPRWVPFNIVWNEERQKHDKIPHNGRHGISTKTPNQWTDLVTAIETVQNNNLPGVGIVMTGGIEVAGWRLIGFDYDKVDFDSFVLPFKTYSEKSPSGTGIRAFIWVPASWIGSYKDTLGAHPLHCDHLEIYIGTSPRFLTVTFQALSELPIAEIQDEKELNKLAAMLKLADPPRPVPISFPENSGTPVDLRGFIFTRDQKLLLAGDKKIDRSAVCHGLIIKLIDEGVPPDDVLATLVETKALWEYCLDHRQNETAKALKFAQDEVNRGYADSMTGKRAKLVGFNEGWKPKPKEPKDQEQAHFPFPMELYDNAPGLIGEIAHWIVQASYSPREEFAYACALSMMACLIGPFCTFGSRAGKVNLYLTLVGGTGTGKNEAIDTMSMLLATTDAKDAILDFPASEAALRRQLNVSPNILLRVDEMAHKLESMANSSNGASLGRAILESYNGARMPPKVYADERKCLPAVENPFVQILAGTTDKVWDTVRTSHMEDGTLNRFIFICLPENPPYRHCLEPDCTIPKELKDRLNVFWRDNRRFALIGNGRHLTFGEGVMAELDLLDRQAWDLEQTEFGSLFTRYAQNTVKVAALLTVSDNRSEISLTDFFQAKRFIKWCLDNTALRCGSQMADTHFERVAKRLLRKLKKGNGQLGMREAYRAMHISRKEMEELITTLMMSGEIEVIEDDDPLPNGNKPQWIILPREE